MKAKTIKQVLRKKINGWLDSIEDKKVMELAKDNIVVTGGCIASMLLKEPVNDYDIYFTNIETTTAVAEYYVDKAGCDDVSVVVEDDRVKITTPDGYRGETVQIGEIDDMVEEVEEKTQQITTDPEKYVPVFISTNAITLSGKVQVILRFFGDPDKIHKNYDFVHCTNYWTSNNGELVLRHKALEALITRELIYVGSLYPVCSIIRLRKFIKRGWSVNAGQILKMTLQAADLDLTDPKVLEDQLTGVDAAYFSQVIEALDEKDPEKINTKYLIEIIDRIF